MCSGLFPGPPFPMASAFIQENLCDWLPPTANSRWAPHARCPASDSLYAGARVFQTWHAPALGACVHSGNRQRHASHAAREHAGPTRIPMMLTRAYAPSTGARLDTKINSSIMQYTGGVSAGTNSSIMQYTGGVSAGPVAGAGYGGYIGSPSPMLGPTSTPATMSMGVIGMNATVGSFSAQPTLAPMMSQPMMSQQVMSQPLVSQPVLQPQQQVSLISFVPAFHLPATCKIASSALSHGFAKPFEVCA